MLESARNEVKDALVTARPEELQRYQGMHGAFELLTELLTRPNLEQRLEHSRRIHNG